VTNFKKPAPTPQREFLPSVGEDNILKKIFANTKQGPRHKKKDFEPVQAIP
jgi:hypothetical protein